MGDHTALWKGFSGGPGSSGEEDWTFPEEERSRQVMALLVRPLSISEIPGAAAGDRPGPWGGSRGARLTSSPSKCFPGAALGLPGQLLCLLCPGGGSTGPHPSPSPGSFSPGVGGPGPWQHRSWVGASKGIWHAGGWQGLLPSGKPWLGWLCGWERVPARQCRGGPRFPVSSVGAFAGGGIWGLHPQRSPSGWTS